MNEALPQPNDELSPEEKFAQAYEGATLTPITYEELPQAVVDHFEANSQKFILPEEYTPRNFSHLYLLTHPDENKTYIAEQTKSYGEGKDTEELAYFIDYIDGHSAGHGELRNNISNPNKFFASKPFVGYTRTYTPEDSQSGGRDFRKQGLGRRRLIEMDAYARTRFGAPLNSDSLLAHDNFSDDASTPRRIWERLAEEGEAEAYVESKDAEGKELIRYRMK